MKLVIINPVVTRRRGNHSRLGPSPKVFRARHPTRNSVNTTMATMNCGKSPVDVLDGSTTTASSLAARSNTPVERHRMETRFRINGLHHKVKFNDCQPVLIYVLGVYNTPPLSSLLPDTAFSPLRCPFSLT